MEIKKTTIITEAQHVTENARYVVSYTMEQDASSEKATLQVTTARVFAKEKVQVPDMEGNPIEQEQEVEVGVLAMEYGMMRSNQFPFSDKYPRYVSDFAEIVNEIINPKK